MRFIQAEIYGFGKWIDETFTFKQDSLMSLYGENESGKSTLQQFLMYMLFGLPPRQLNRFKPRASNKIGGKLTVVDDEIGRYTIERVASKASCLLPDGKTEDEAWLQEKLGGLTREIYTSIYTFSAIDLEEIRNINEVKLSDVLFSVGLTGATNISKLERQLDNRLGNLFKVRGQNPDINQQITKVETLDAKVKEFQSNEAVYAEKQMRKAELEGSIAESKMTLAALESKSRMYENLLQYRATIEELYHIEEVLDTYTDEMYFPENGIERQQHIKDQLIPLQAKFNALEVKQAALAEKCTTISEKLLPSHVIKLAEEILAKKQVVMERDYSLTQLATDLKESDKTINERLLAIELDETTIDNVSIPFQLANKWEKLASEVSVLSQEKEGLLEEEQIIKNTEFRLQKKLDVTVAGMIDDKEMQKNKEQVNAYELGIYQQTEQAKQEEELIVWQEKRKKTVKNIFIGTSVFGLLFAMIFFITNTMLYLGIGGLIIILAIGQFIHSINAMKQMTQFYQSPAEGELITQTHFQQLKQVIDQQNALQVQLQNERYDLERIKNDYLQWQDKFTVLQQKELRVNRDIASERLLYPFLKQMEPVHWVGYLHLIKEVKSLINDKQKLIEKEAKLKEEAELFQEKIKQYANYTGMDEENITLSKVEEMIMQDAQSRAVYDEAEIEFNNNHQAKEQLAAAINEYEVEEKVLFDYAGVQSVEEYYQMAQKIEQYNELVTDKEKALNQMNLIFTAEVVEQVLMKQFNLGDVEHDLARIVNKLEQGKVAQQHLHEALAKINIEINAMESSDDYSESQFRLQIERDKLNEMSEEWAVMKVVQTVLAQAKKSYQEKYLGEVMKLTSSYFKQMTAGRYNQVYAPQNRELFQVETAKLDKFEVGELSQGTVDQLYISLRLAISKVMSEKYKIPLIIDDAFVHFDDGRRARGVELLMEIAKEQQVFLFTCHEHLAMETAAIEINR